MNLDKTISRIRSTVAGLVAILLASFASGALPLTGNVARAAETISVMTRNLFVGTDFQKLLAATTPDEFRIAVTTSYQAILETKPAERMAAIAREIARLKPDLVGLQEATILRTGTTPPATKVEIDFVQVLVRELFKLGQYYTAVAILPGLDAEAPTNLGFDARFTLQDVILARTDRLLSEFGLANLQVQRYLLQHTVPTPIGPILNPSGWASIDVQFRGRRLRFVTTHLALSPGGDTTVPLTQARELVWAAGRTKLPVVFVGDFNSTANTSASPTFVIYQTFVAAGFVDAWSRANPLDPGLTCCQAADLRNIDSLLSIRNDLIFTRNGLDVVDVRLVGNQQSDRTPSGLWPSDHAGIVATLKLAGE